mmetsp:Transcript_10874/g.26687  ORF Transcript_10874/g.26687 Transcript_10874/m.26687 type:complete len:315 (+) Transcript_10874:627-1571(+)|eukprot:CAMPEP_0179001670 /NCGR_PEP_ID=MMETSP0795-20121207/11508_1 /TAXON_ID=88552 /ORGANISM="Amoebophrya sp., Strain Ameob2" /LENGTH=314 /DNA_ID=CAMNT_0020695107 /DNA_START=623 /DNA_END=1567 /DNA_ORIENTATION=+
MYRQKPVGSRLCEKRNEERRAYLHKEKLRNMQPHIDTSEPFCLRLDHIRNNLKREQLLEERYGEIDRENRILLQKMSDIMRNTTVGSQKPGASGTRAHVSMNRDARKKELLRITHENQLILKRIQRAQPMYNHVKWEESYKQNQTYLKNCCEYPVVLRKQMAAGLEGSLAAQATVGEGSGKLEKYSEKAADLKYVLKEGKKIGESYYLVEMATDGRTLTISAYDGDTQKTLELLVNEKNHRRLYRECNGDYSLLANRLHVERDRLILVDTIATRGMGGQAAKQLNADEIVQKSGKHVDISVGKDGTAGVNVKGM